MRFRHTGPLLIPDPRVLIRGADCDLPKLCRPAHWLPHEPLVTLHDDGGDDFHEATLELGGRIAATRIVSDHDSALMALRDFKNVIDANCDRGT